jgi:hypothetical protein
MDGRFSGGSSRIRNKLQRTAGKTLDVTYRSVEIAQLSATAQSAIVDAAQWMRPG